MKVYKWLKGLRKGLVAATAVASGLIVGAEALTSLSPVQEVGAVGGVSALVLAIRTGLNWWKFNKGLASGPYVR